MNYALIVPKDYQLVIQESENFYAFFRMIKTKWVRFYQKFLSLMLSLPQNFEIISYIIVRIS